MAFNFYRLEKTFPISLDARGCSVFEFIGDAIAQVAGKKSGKPNSCVYLYPFFAGIKATECNLRVGANLEISGCNFEEVLVVETAKLIEWAGAEYQYESETWGRYVDDFHGWCNDSEEDISEWIAENAVKI